MWLLVFRGIMFRVLYSRTFADIWIWDTDFEKELQLIAGRDDQNADTVGFKPGDTLSSRHVSSHKTYVLFSTPSLSLPMRWLSYADLCNLVTWCQFAHFFK